jgi:hypothetical protein
MVARDHRLGPAEEQEAALHELYRRAALAAQVGPCRRPYGALRQPTFPTAGTQQISKNTTQNRILFVTVTVIGTAAIVFSKSDSSGVAGYRTTLSDNQPGQMNNAADFVLFPGDELHAASSANTQLQTLEQTY